MKKEELSASRWEWRWHREAEGEGAPDWSRWDACVLQSPGSASFFLDSRQVRAALSVADRRVWALVAVEVEATGEERWWGVSVVEDVTAESRVDASYTRGGGRLLGHLGKCIHGRSGVLGWQVRVAGSVLGSGEHAYRHHPSLDSAAFRAALLKELQRSILPGHPQSQQAPPVCLIKDFMAGGHALEGPGGELPGPGETLSGGRQVHADWIDLEFDPVMTVHVDSEWKQPEDYLAALKTKARTKVKRILECSKDCGFEVWGLAQLVANRDAVHALYHQVYGDVGFRLGKMHPEDWVEQKRTWGDDFRVVAVYHDGVLRGFQCGYLMPDRVEAFYVGFDRSMHRELAMYQRMLVEFISWGIERGAKVVVMGRTALDIKSSVGAVPHRAYCAVWFRNPALHLLARKSAKLVRPQIPPLKQAWRVDARATAPAVA